MYSPEGGAFLLLGPEDCQE